MSTNFKSATNRRSMFEQFERRELLTTLVISEINHTPYEPSAEFGDLSDKSGDYEFIELLNFGDASVNLEGIQFVKADTGSGAEGVDFIFGPQSLAPGERIVVVEDTNAFASRYGQNINIAGKWSGSLGKSETLTLQAADGTTIQQFAYDSKVDWPTRASGLGATLELKKPDSDPSDPSSWNSSDVYGGTPGQDSVTVETTIIINEVLPHTDLPSVDAIEILNTTTTPIDIGRWYVTDDLADPYRFSFPTGTRVGANGYTVIDEADFNADGKGFALSEQGDDLWIISANSTGRPLAYVDHVRFEASENGVALGLLPNGNKKSDMLPLASPTLGSANTAHLVGDVVISEVQYNPADDDVFKEFIELQNTTDSTIPLGDWRILDAVDIIIPSDVFIDASETVVLVAFDPVDSAMASAFRDTYRISQDVTLVGPWGTNSDGFPVKLSNGGEKITLMFPIDDHGTIVFAVADQVDFNDKAPWPIEADGTGSSLARIAVTAFGNDPSSWKAAAPTPGNEVSPQIVGDVNHDGIFNSRDLVQLFQIGEYDDGIVGNSTYDEGDWNGDGDFDSADLVVAFEAGTYKNSALGDTSHEFTRRVPDFSANIVKDKELKHRLAYHLQQEIK